MKAPNKKTKTAVTTAIIATALLVGALSHAKPAHNSDDRYDRYEHTGRYQHDQRNKHARKHRKHRDVLRLDIPVHVRGSETIQLRRLAKRHYNINLNNYRLRKVVVDNHGRRYASANVRVGRLATGRQHLTRGKNHLMAPQHSDGRWLLGVKGARISNIRLVLEPKERWAYHHEPHQQPRAWFNDTRW